MNTVSRSVLDASAILAVLNNEPGVEKVTSLLPEASVSAVNVAEVLAKLISKGMPAPVALEAFRALRVRVVPFEVEDAARTLSFVARNISLGDRAFLATAARVGVPAVTADRKLADSNFPVPVRIDVIR
jgi:ribonuclease VapC